MAMGICNDDEFQAELARLGLGKSNGNTTKTTPQPESTPPTARVEEKKERGWNGGRSSEHTDVPEVLRKVIGDSAIEGRSNSSVARAFGVSESSVAAYKVGANSTASYHRPDKELLQHMRMKRLAVADRAHGMLGRALDSITDDKLEASKARDLASIAKDMSAVIRNMEPEMDKDSTNNTNIVFYSPKTKTEEDYITVQVEE